MSDDKVWAAVPDTACEAIGERIVEEPKDFALAELRTPRSGGSIYVPPGSLNRKR